MGSLYYAGAKKLTSSFTAISFIISAHTKNVRRNHKTTETFHVLRHGQSEALRLFFFVNFILMLISIIKPLKKQAKSFDLMGFCEDF